MKKSITICSMILATALYAQESPQTQGAAVASEQNAPAKVDTAKADVPKPVADTAKAAPETDRFATIKARKHKVAYDDYMAKKIAKRDSIAAITYHHGISFAGAHLTDKRLGDLDADNTWGASGSLYYFYRMYFNDYIGLQARFGGMIRYSRFDVYKLTDKKITYNGKSYSIVKEKEVDFTNFSLDIPVTVKFGAHLNPTTFLYGSLTAGVTKPFYEVIHTQTGLLVDKPSGDLYDDVQFLKNNGYLDAEDGHASRGNFKVTDIEANSWIGFGLETRHIGFSYQMLIAACSPQDNHRYKDMFDKDFPSWRFTIDFSLR